MFGLRGFDVGGISCSAAVDKLVAEGKYPQTGVIALEDQGKIWVFSPIELGLIIDQETSIAAAFSVGRQGWRWDRWGLRVESLRYGTELTPQLILDQRLTQAQLNLIAAEINQPMVEASLQLNNFDVVAQPGQIGRQLDMEATIQLILQPASSMLDASIKSGSR